jgi:hypothetical protein
MTNANSDIINIWKSASVDQYKITKNEIDDFKRKKKTSIYSSLQSTCLIQVFQKIIYGLALFYGFFSFGNGNNITLAIAIILLTNSLLLALDFRLLSRIRRLKQVDNPVKNVLKELESFLQTDFFIYRFYAAFSNPILIITGVLYYFHFKYGHFESLTEPDSLIVFGIITLISFGIGYVGMVFSSHKIMDEIHSYMEILEESDNYTKIIEKDKKQRFKRVILMLFLLIAGIVLFLLIL